jgi:hypothetical protein
VATKPSDASAAPKTPAPAGKTNKTQRKAADKSTKSTKVVKGKGNGRGRKPSSTAASTSSTSAAEVPDLDDDNDHSSLIFTTEDLVNLSEDEQKAKLVNILRHEEINDIYEPIPPSKEESLRARLRLGNADVNKLLRRFAPGCTTKRSTDILILADYLRRAIFPADVSVTIEHFYIICCCKSRLTLINCSQNLEGVPACRQNGSVLCDISLRSTYYHITRIPPQSGNGVTQQTLKEAIQKQVDSVRNGGNHYYTDSSDDQLKERLQRLGVKSKQIPTKRPALLRKLWEKEPVVSSTTVVGSGNDRNAPVVSVYSAVCYCLLLLAVSIYKHLNFFQSIYFPQELITDAHAAPAPSLIGSIGSDENANAVAVVPPTPIQGNQQNVNGVAPPQVDGNLLYALFSEQRRTNDEQRRTNNRYDERFQAMQRANNAQMIEQRRTNDEQRRINDRNDERFLRNDERFQAMQRANNAHLMEQRRTNDEQRRTNDEQRRTNDEQRRTNDEQRRTNDEQRRTNDDIEARLQTVEKMARERTWVHPSSDFDSSGGKSTITSSHCEIILESYLTLSSSSSFLFVTVNNDGDESISDCLSRRLNLKPHESPQQEILSGASPERATAAGARRASDDQSEENVSDNEKSNDSWKLDDEDGIDGAEGESQMESDDNSEDDESTLSECDNCKDQEAQTYCFDKNCRRNFHRLTGTRLF